MHGGVSDNSVYCKLVRLKVGSDSAFSLNVLFDSFLLPKLKAEGEKRKLCFWAVFYGVTCPIGLCRCFINVFPFVSSVKSCLVLKYEKRRHCVWPESFLCRSYYVAFRTAFLKQMLCICFILFTRQALCREFDKLSVTHASSYFDIWSKLFFD